MDGVDRRGHLPNATSEGKGGEYCVANNAICRAGIANEEYGFSDFKLYFINFTGIQSVLDGQGS